MTKELKLEECVNLLSGTVSTGGAPPSAIATASTTTGAYRQQHKTQRRHSKPTTLLPPPTSPYVSGNSGTSPGHPQPQLQHLQHQLQHVHLQHPPPQQQQYHSYPPPLQQLQSPTQPPPLPPQHLQLQLQLQPPPQHQYPPPPQTSTSLHHNSTFAGQSLITSTPKAMIRRNSKHELRGGYQCTIRLLDDAEILQCDFQPHHKGQFIMDFVCRQLNIAEKDYFGLRFVDSNKQRHWLDLSKSIVKQLKDMAYIVCFRFKFYPSDPMLLKEEVSRYQLVLQLRRDILHGRLYSTLSDMAALASFIIQSELGDYDPEVHSGNYITDYELVSRQSHDLEDKAIELHQKLKGLTPSEADILFLKKAATLDTYGIDPHPVKDQQAEQLYLGINHTGISTFQGSKKSTHFKWSQITKLNYEAKMFIIHLTIPEDSRNKKKETVGFKCQTSSSCKYLWRCAVEQRLFFTCGCAGDIPSSVRGGGIFGTRFRYSGRVQREILEDPGPLRASDSVISRTPLTRSLHLQRNKTRSLPHTPLQIGYGSLPRSNHSAPPHESTRLDGLGSSTSLPLSTLSSPYCQDQILPLLETLREDSPRVEEKGKISTGLEQVSRNLSNILEKGLDERVEKEFLSTQEETLTSIPEDPETEAEVIGGGGGGGVGGGCGNVASPSSSLAQLSSFSTTSASPTTAASNTPSATATSFVESKQSMSKDSSFLIESQAGKPSGKLAVGNGRAIFHTNHQLDNNEHDVKNNDDDDDNDSNFNDKNNNDEIMMAKATLNNNYVSTALKTHYNENQDEKITLSRDDEEKATKESEEAEAQAQIQNLLSKSEEVPKQNGHTHKISNGSAFVPVYNAGTDAPEGVCLSSEEKPLRESKIDQVASISPSSTVQQIAYRKRTQHNQNPQGALLSVWKVFIVCFICVLIALLLVAILAIEIDIDICQKMRRIPEVEIFQSEVYDPLKRFISDKLRSASSSL